MAFVPFGDAAAVAAAVAADVVAAVGGDGLLVWVDLLRGGDSVGCCGYCPLTWEVCASNPRMIIAKYLRDCQARLKTFLN